MNITERKSRYKRDPNRMNTKAFFNLMLMLAVIISTSLSILSLPGHAWDGEWTYARSGDWPGGYDPGNSNGKAHAEKPLKRDFFIPPIPAFEDLDPEEFEELTKKGYTPYVVARFHFDIRVNGKVMPKGYYQIKVGQYSDGSPNTTLAGPSSGFNTGLMPGSREKFRNHWWQFNRRKAPREVFVIKHLGKVMNVVAITRIEPYIRDKDEKKQKQDLAWLEKSETGNTVLKLYHKKMLYIADITS